MGQQQGQQMMMMPMPMGHHQGQQMMMMPMAMQGQQMMMMPMAMGPQGQPMMATGATQMQLGQQQSQPGLVQDKPVKIAAKSGVHAKEPKQGSKLKNASLSGAGIGSALTPRPETAKVESKVEPNVESKEAELQERKRELHRQASEVVQRLRENRARRAGLEESAAQLKHSTFSALNLEVSSATQRGKVQPLMRQNLEVLRQDLKDMQMRKLAAEKAAVLALPPGSWAGKPASSAASTTASDDGLETLVESDEESLEVVAA